MSKTTPADTAPGEDPPERIAKRMARAAPARQADTGAGGGPVTAMPQPVFRVVRAREEWRHRRSPQVGCLTSRQDRGLPVGLWEVPASGRCQFMGILLSTSSTQ